MSEVLLYPEAGLKRQRSLGADMAAVWVQGYLTDKQTHPLGPYRRPMPRVLGGS